MNEFGIVARIRGRGLGAIARRALREVYAPQTKLGLALRPLTAILWWPIRLLTAQGRTPRTADAAAWNRALTLFYDLDIASATFDFVLFIAFAEAERRRRGLAHLDVVFVPGRKDGLRAEMMAYEAAVDLEARRWRLHNVCIPSLALAPGCRGYTLAATREQAAAEFALRGGARLPADYDLRFPVPPSGKELILAARQGLDLHVLQSPPQALAYVRQWIDEHARGRKLVTITLRDYAFMPGRNSNFAAWAAFARELDPARFCVVIVPDTEVAMRASRPEFAGLPEFAPACWNVALRSAIYESAWLNLGASGGPMALCWFNAKVRYVMFKILVPDVPQATATFLAEHGYAIGEQPPFARRDQKWVWEPDDLDVIRREFSGMVSALGNS